MIELRDVEFKVDSPNGELEIIDKINLKIESGKLSDEQKTLLIKRVTEVSAEIMNIPQEFFTTTITELPDTNFGIGGKTIDIIKSEYKRNR